jgi:hypothetical protein
MIPRTREPTELGASLRAAVGSCFASSSPQRKCSCRWSILQIGRPPGVPRPPWVIDWKGVENQPRLFDPVRLITSCAN